MVHIFDINRPSLPTPFYSVLASVSVLMALSTVFPSVNSPDNSPRSHYVLPVGFLPSPFNYICIYGSFIIPDIVLCG